MRFSFVDRSGRSMGGIVGKVGRAARKGLVVVLCSCLLLSGCTMADDTAKKDIELVVDGFMKDVMDGSFAANGFVSEAVTDVSFSGAEFSNEKLRDVVKQVMGSMKYTPGIVTASMQEKIGSCSISVTSLDYATVLKGVDTEYLTVDNLVKLVDEKSTSTKSTQVVFGMTYDEASKKWTIADAKSFFKLVAGPCATADMPENYGVYIKPLLDALGNNSRDDFRNVCSGYEFLEFYSPVYTENDILVEYFKLCSIEVVKERVDAKKGEVVVDVKMTMPNLEAIDAKLLKDHDLVCELFELYITNLLDGNTPGNTMVKVMDIYKEPFIEALKAKDLPMTTVEGSFTLVKNGMIEADEMAFMVDVVPEKLLYKENIFMYIDDGFGAECMNETIDKLVEEGRADRVQIDEAFKKWFPDT